jgi:hypothetical protein
LTGFNGVDSRSQGRYKRHEILKTISARDKNHDRDPELLEVLLKREVPIHRHEHVIGVRRKGKQLAIFLASPAGLWDRTNLMAGE